MGSVPLSSAGINQVSIFLDQGLPPKTEHTRDCVTGHEKAIPLPSYNTSLSQGDLLHTDYVENRAEISLQNPDPMNIWALSAHELAHPRTTASLPNICLFHGAQSWDLGCSSLGHPSPRAEQ